MGGSLKLSPETIETGEALRVIGGKGYDNSKPIEEYSIIVVLDSYLCLNITSANAVLQYNRAAIIRPGTHTIEWTHPQSNQRIRITETFRDGVFYYFYMEERLLNNWELLMTELHNDGKLVTAREGKRNYIDIPQTAIINGIKVNVEKNNVRPPINL